MKVAAYAYLCALLMISVTFAESNPTLININHIQNIAKKQYSQSTELQRLSEKEYLAFVMRPFETLLSENSQNELVYRPSVAVIDSGMKRFSYTYDASGKNLLIELEEVKVGGSFVPRTRSTYTYNSSGKETEWIYESYVNSQWVPEQRSFKSYDQAGNLSSLLEEKYENSAWVPFNRATYTYNAENLLTVSVGEIYISGTWQPTARITYTYNANRFIATSLTEYHGVTWVNSSRVFYDYFPNNLLKGFAMEMWQNAWEKQSKTEYTYNQNNLLISDVTYSWNGQAYIESDMILYSYFGSGKLVSEHAYMHENGQWVSAWQRKYFYNVGEFLLREVYETFSDNLWTSVYRVDYTDDGFGNAATGIYNHYENGQWVYQVGYVPMHFNSTKSNISYEAAFVEMTYVSYVMDVQDAYKPDGFVLEQNYPNPFNPSTIIRFSIPMQSDIRLSVFNALGEEVATIAEGVYAAGNYDINFTANGLSSGVYYYRLSAGDMVKSAKMLLLK